jgi:hypothetical protein
LPVVISFKANRFELFETVDSVDGKKNRADREAEALFSVYRDKMVGLARKKAGN